MNTCSFCGKEYKGRGKYFCSKACAGKGKPKKKTEKFCKVCETPLDGRKRRNKTYCSKACINNDPDIKEATSKRFSGIKQSEETIRKRVENTDQVSKERKRKSTMIDRYGVDNWSRLEETKILTSERMKGVPNPRDEDWQNKIIESKRNNCTLKHSDETKNKIRNKVKETVNHPDFDKSVFLTQSNNYVNGYLNDLYYRSSYEKSFIELCGKLAIKITSAENNTFSVEYGDDKGNSRKYFPDFYLPDLNLIIEVKPKSMLNVGNNPYKILAAKEYYGDNYKIITEYDIESIEKLKSILIDVRHNID